MIRRIVHSGFTLIELMVVVAIIGILAGVLFATFGSATDSARAVQCLSNLKSLAQGANTYAMRTSYYPIAGSVEVRDLAGGAGKFSFSPLPGWISWYDEGVYEDNEGNHIATSHKSIQPHPYNGLGEGEANEEKNTYVLTNGTLWASTSKNRKLYVCPEHIRLCHDNKVSQPIFSYVMNSKFGYDYSQGDGSVGYWHYGIKYGTLSRADRVLMFAELPYINPEDGTFQEPDDIWQRDCTLQYKAHVGSKDYKMKQWKGTPESIGFTHRVGKRGWCAHVAFADGHVEKITYSPNGLSLDQVTALLCEGIDVAFSEKDGYVLPNDSDKMND